MAIRGFIELVSPELIEGWCYDDERPGDPLGVRLAVNHSHQSQTQADRYRPDLAESGYATGCHAFQFSGHWYERDEDEPLIEVQVIDMDGTVVMSLPHLHSSNRVAVHEPPLPLDVRPKRRLQTIQLHIGLEKAGSSSLQRFLKINQRSLAERGIWVPNSLAPQDGRDLLNHSALVAYALDIGKESDEIRRLHGCASTTSIKEFRERVVHQIADEIDRSPSSTHTLVLSNEHLHSRLLHRSEVERLRYLLMPFCDRVEITVYLRPQHRIAVSAHATLIKNGGLQLNPFPSTEPDAPWTEAELMSYYNFDALLERWESVWGQASVHPVILEGAIERLFVERLSLSYRDFTALEERVNVGLSPAGLALLRELNELLCHRPWTESQQIREAVISTFERQLSGFGAVGRASQAQAFQERFSASNERIRQRHFPERAQLFDDDWSIYQANDMEPTVSLEAVAAVLRHLSRVLLAYKDGEPLPMIDEALLETGFLAIGQISD